EKDPSIFHGISKFDIDSGEYKSSSLSYSDVFGECLCRYASKDSSICAITAAMGLGTGLRCFSDNYPDRFFDVGIAEEHAVTFACGLAKNGLKPVYAVYSTFLQRCYDQIVHDISLQKQKVVLAVDRAGFVGEDGETHHGLLDVAFLSTIPDIRIYSPCCFSQLKDDLGKALYEDEGCVAVRYPRGAENENTCELDFSNKLYSLYGDSNADNVIVTYGRLTSCGVDAVKELSDKGKSVQLISLNQIKPLPEKAVELIFTKQRVFFFEEGQKSGGIGEKLGSVLMEKGFKGAYNITAVEDKFAGQASIASLLSEYGLDKDAMIKKITEK
ncbi:MAG: 1-deoxy-D-xylulose-5-phosphate synthase, partial [Clostridia bacterium]|nr:1-deoxy-D-xylulose-5-phosphate synthase [Clostridia bacterium]